MKNSARVAVAGLLSITSIQAMADVWFAPRVEYSFTNYQQSLQAQSETGESDSNTGDGNLQADLNLLTIGGGATFGISAFYIDIDVKATQDSELHEFYNDQFVVSGFELKDNGGLDRSEVSLTTGFGFEHFSLFGGLKLTSTEFQHEIYYDDSIDATPSYPAFSVNIDGVSTDLVTHTTFESTGLFGGISIQFTFGESGALSLSGAYSQILSATIKDDWAFEQSRYDLEGTGNGLSATAKLTYGWFYAKAEYSQYDYTDYENNADNDVQFEEDVSEKFARVGGGISILF